MPVDRLDRLLGAGRRRKRERRQREEQRTESREAATHARDSTPLRKPGLALRRRGCMMPAAVGGPLVDASDHAVIAGGVEARLRSLLEEARLGGLPAPDRATWERRFPAHVAAIGKLFDAASGAESATPPAPAPGPAPANPEPLEEVVRTDPHGALLRRADGSLVYRIPASRLGRRSPAMDYLRRIRRAAAADIRGIERARLRRDAGGGISVRWRPLRGRPVLRRPGTRTARFERDAIEAIAGAAGLLETLHAAGGAHGRLGLDDLRFDRRRRRAAIVMGYASGPGRDGADVGALQAADVRALGAMLYGVLDAGGPPPETADLLARHAAEGLPALRARRPRLLPALAECAERALAAGRSERGYAGMAALRADLDRVLAFESSNPGWESRAWRRRPVLVAATVFLLALFAAFVAPGLQARGDDVRMRVDPPPDPRLAHVRALVRSGRLNDAREAWDRLGRELGIDDGLAIPEVADAAEEPGTK